MQPRHWIGFFVVIPILLATARAQEELPPATSAPAAPHGGRLQAETEMWDFGSYWYGEKPQTQIRVTNIGTQAVVIRNVQQGCSCTSARMEKKQLAPGDSDMLYLAIDSLKVKDRFPSKTIAVETDIPDQNFLRIIIKGEFKPVLEFEPRDAMVIGRIGLDQQVTKEVMVRCTYEKPMMLKLRAEPNAWIDFDLKELETGKLYKLTMRTKPPMPLAEMKGTAIIETGSTVCPEYTLKLDGYVLDRIQLIPEFIHVNPRSQNRNEFLLNLVYHEDIDLKIERMEANFEGVEFGEPRLPKPLRLNEHYRHIVIPLKTPAAAGIPPGLAGKITIHTNNPKYPKLVVPIATIKPVSADNRVQVPEPPPASEPTSRGTN